MRFKTFKRKIIKKLLLIKKFDNSIILIEFMKRFMVEMNNF